MNALEKISDYFLGTEIKKFYCKERTFYMSHIEDSKERDKHLKELEKDEKGYIRYGKILPNIVDAGAIIGSCLSSNIILPGIAVYLSELYRHSMSSDFESKKEDYSSKEVNIHIKSIASNPKSIEKIAAAIKGDKELVSEVHRISKDCEEILKNNNCTNCDKK